jgi:hypothetical protein
MKKVILAMIIVLAAAGVAFAHGHQGNGHHGTVRNCYVNGGHYHNGVYYDGHH